jgi:hypothetical protein
MHEPEWTKNPMDTKQRTDRFHFSTLYLPLLGNRGRSARESHVPRRIPSVLTVVICVLTALAEAGLGIMCSNRVSASDIIVVLFIVGPCLVSGSLAWYHRGPREGVWALLAIAIGMSACGLDTFGDHSYRWAYRSELSKGSVDGDLLRSANPVGNCSANRDFLGRSGTEFLVIKWSGPTPTMR